MSDLEILTQSLARNVKHWRSVRGFTLDVLAARAGVTRHADPDRAGPHQPSIGTVVKIGDALGVSITTLLDYEQGPGSGWSPPNAPYGCAHTEAGSYNQAARRHGERPDRWRCGTGG